MKLGYLSISESGILDIINNTNQKNAIGNNSINYPIMDKYNYLGVRLNKKLRPETHLKYYKPNINYLISRFKMIPTKSIILRYLVNYGL